MPKEKQPPTGGKRPDLDRRLRKILVKYPKPLVEKFIQSAFFILALTPTLAKSPTRRERLAALKLMARDARQFVNVLSVNNFMLSAGSEKPLTAGPLAEAAESEGGLPCFLVKLQDESWRPAKPSDPQMEAALRTGDINDLVAAMRYTAPAVTALHTAWQQAIMSAANLESELKSEIAKTKPPRRGRSESDYTQMLTDVAAVYARTFGDAPTLYRDGLFYEIARVLTGLEDPSRPVTAAVNAANNN